jgi:ubiquinone/menaquinone biosynthesis C-methylase UbiE
MPPPDDREIANAAVPSPAPERGPSMIDLLRLSRSKGFSPRDQNLYRQIAVLVGLPENDEIRSLIDAPSGRGAVAQFFAERYEVEASGVDPDPDSVEIAEQRARDSGLASRLHFQSAPLDDLPYQDGVFDLAIGELGLARASDPHRAVAELARVTRPYGRVMLIALIWTRQTDEERRRILVQHLGAPPMMLVEWKQALRDALVVDLQVEDWSDQVFPFLVRGRTFSQLAELPTTFDRLSILWRAWKRWGWRGLKGAWRREYQIRKLLGQERTIGVTLIKGTKWEDEGGDEAGAEPLTTN